MMEKNTNQLLHELMDTNDLDRILSENTASFRTGNLPQALQTLFEARNTTKSALAKASGISEVYLHQVFLPPATGFYACASGCRPAWRRPKVC